MPRGLFTLMSSLASTFRRALFIAGPDSRGMPINQDVPFFH
jgi:hypothetical protein